MSVSDLQRLSDALTDQVLEKLGLSGRPSADTQGLSDVYRAWCHKVPSDNIRLMLYRVTASTGPLPGESASLFFQSWLSDGLGGVCWEVNGALHGLLTTLGFDARYVMSTMMPDTAYAYRHGSLAVNLNDQLYLTDGTVLHGNPQPLNADVGDVPEHLGWGVRVRHADGRCFVFWKPLHFPDGIEFRLDSLAVTAEQFNDGYQEAHEIGRKRGRRLFTRIIRDEKVVGIADDKWVEIDRAGETLKRRLSKEELPAMLVEKLGIKEEVVRLLPPDAHTRPY